MTNKQLLEFLAKNDKQVQKHYDKLISELSKISVSLDDIPDDKIFSFADYPNVSKQVASVLENSTKGFVSYLQNAIQEAMRLSFAATTSALGAYSVFSNPQLRSIRNTAAEAFIESRMKPAEGLSLSQKVWNYASQTKSEFEVAISSLITDGLKQGISAEELGRMLRSRLNDPEMMYRRYHEKRADGSDAVFWRKRVIDDEGKVRFVKGEIEKVGQGVYRSARKNARRLAATEINMAYEYADCIRYQSEPFVLGIRISLSGNHTLNGKPFYDICDELQGVYPKSFMFNGFHPLCRCVLTSILCSKEELNNILKLPPEERGKYPVFRKILP